MSVKIGKYTLIAAAALTAAAATAAIWVAVSFRGNAVKEDKELYISRAMTYDDLLATLDGSIRHRTAFDIYARRINLQQTVKPGHYILRKGMNVIEAARMLKLGEQTPVRVIINNVRVNAELASKLARQLEADSAAICRALTCDSLARSAGFDSLSLFSMFIPDTYEFYWTATPADIIKRMRREYDRFWNPQREAALARCKLSRYEVMTLASIVYEETKAADEMPRIAGVYINRLRTGMPLQADPTVKYALGDFSLRRILKSHLKTKSPYNTYINKGLPPSPICMPSISAIDAVLNFESHNYLYFCARPELDGHHNFAATYPQHLANARAYAAALDAREKTARK